MIPEVKRILYASDIEEGGRPAFRAAIRLCLCGNFNAKITFLNIIEPIGSTAKSLMKNMINDTEMKSLHDNGIANLKAKLMTRIDHFLEQEVSEQEMLKADQIVPRVEEGEPWKVILSVAKEIDASVIVMGTRKHSGIGLFLLGSTAAKVMHHSTIPVLIVPIP